MFCDKVTEVILPKSLESIGQAAFHACGISTIDIPSSVTSIADGAFLTCCNLKRLELPPGLKKIEEALCCGCDGKTGADWDSAPEQTGTLLMLQS